MFFLQIKIVHKKIKIKMVNYVTIKAHLAIIKLFLSLFIYLTE